MVQTMRSKTRAVHARIGERQVEVILRGSEMCCLKLEKALNSSFLILKIKEFKCKNMARVLI